MSATWFIYWKMNRTIMRWFIRSTERIIVSYETMELTYQTSIHQPEVLYLQWIRLICWSIKGIIDQHVFHSFCGRLIIGREKWNTTTRDRISLSIGRVSQRTTDALTAAINNIKNHNTAVNDSFPLVVEPYVVRPNKEIERNQCMGLTLGSWQPSKRIEFL